MPGRRPEAKQRKKRRTISSRRRFMKSFELKSWKRISDHEELRTSQNTSLRGLQPAAAPGHLANAFGPFVEILRRNPSAKTSVERLKAVSDATMSDDKHAVYAKAPGLEGSGRDVFFSLEKTGPTIVCIY
jgi:hypothetical protein